MEQFNIFFESLRSFMLQLGSFLPKILGAIVILIIGWIIAKIIKMLIVRVLKLFRLDYITEKAGIEKFLKDGGVKLTSVEILGALAYWLIMLIVLLAAFNSLGLGVASDLFRQIILYIPNVFVAVAILIIGLFLANFVKEILLTYLKNVGVERSEVMSQVSYYAVIIFAVLIALDQLNIGTDIINSAFKYIIGGACLALALAFGLGGREWASHVLEKYWKK